MKNFIFKSEADFHKIVFNKLDMLLAEQRNQRSDLGILLALINKLINAANLQKQVDDYFDKDDEGESRLGLPLEDNMKDIPED